MRCWLPSGLRLASTTLGLEYAVEVAHVQCRMKVVIRKMTLTTTMMRESMPNTPGLTRRLVPRTPVVVVAAPAGAAVTGFLDGADAGSSSTGGIGSSGVRNVSRSSETAHAAATQTHGVSVSMRRTMTPAK